MRRYKVEMYMKYVFAISACSLGVPFLYHLQRAPDKNGARACAARVGSPAVCAVTRFVCAPFLFHLPSMLGIKAKVHDCQSLMLLHLLLLLPLLLVGLLGDHAASVCYLHGVQGKDAHKHVLCMPLSSLTCFWRHPACLLCLNTARLSRMSVRREQFGTR